MPLLPIAAFIAVGLFAVLSGSRAQGSSSIVIDVGSPTGPDAPLKWSKTHTITGPDAITCRWSTTMTNVPSARYVLYRVDSGSGLLGGRFRETTIQSGSVAVPQPGKFAQFTVVIGSLPPPPAKGKVSVYRIRVVPTQRIRLARPNYPYVTIRYVNPGEPTKFTVKGLATTPPMKTLGISLKSIRIMDEDDPLSSDEPYLITIGFKCRVEARPDKTAYVVPGTLDVKIVGGGPQNNLGRSGDNWAEEVKTYSINGHCNYSAKVPKEGWGYVVGTAIVFMEEDAFENSTATLMRWRIHDAVKEAVGNLSMSGIDRNKITDAVADKITGDIGDSLKSLDIGGFIQALASAADPDDFGGIAMVVALTLPKGIVQVFAGVTPANLAAAKLKPMPANGTFGFSLNFPIGNVSSAPSNARYKGKSRISGVVTQTM